MVDGILCDPVGENPDGAHIVMVVRAGAGQLQLCMFLLVGHRRRARRQADGVDILGVPVGVHRHVIFAALVEEIHFHRQDPGLF